ncbi:MAG TPA: head GIN domain-containing protein [Bacteroidales bacterium]|nr:MAG: hypothetical protein BWY22_01325 [Bacteroidetes bacterium ADurb.Bin217]HPM12011.1 head GIN domain-containing protein [Bacteroidales bacterium]
MKTMTKSMVLVWILATSVSCIREVGIGTVITETREVANFTKLELSNSADVEIVSGDTLLVEVSDYENLLDNIVVETRGSTLVIKNKPLRVALRNSCANIKITMPTSISSVQVSGSGNVTVHDCVSKDLELNISGSGNISAESSEQLETVEAIISGSGNIELQGTGTSVDAVVSGSGNITCKDFVAQRTDCTISGSGDVKTHTVERLDVTISGSGNVTYYGKPAVNTRISGSGRVMHKE